MTLAPHLCMPSLLLHSATALMLSIVHANNITNDAMSHWLLGVQLVAVYMIIAITYLYRP